MQASLLRRLERQERAVAPAGFYSLAWNDHGEIVPLTATAPVIPISGRRCFQRRVVFDRFPSQRAFDQIQSTYKGFSGSVGSGKSNALCHEAIKCAYLNPGVPGLLGAPTEKLLRNSTLIELLSILESQSIPYRYLKASNVLHLTEPGSTVFLASLDNPESLRAMNLGWFGVDELSYCKEQSWTRLEARLRHPAARYRSGFAVWTPKGRDWVWKRFVSSRKVANYEAVQATPFENTAILNRAPEYYENLKNSYDEKFYRQEVLGEYLDMYSGSVYHAYSAANLRECTFNSRLPLIVTLDFNVNPMSGLLIQCETYGKCKTVHVLGEIVLPGSHTEAWCQRLLTRIQGWVETLSRQNRLLEIQVYGDANGGSTQASSGGKSNWDIVARMIGSTPGCRMRALYKTKNPAVVDRVNAVNGLLCNAAEQERKERRFYVDPSCRELLTDLEEVRWKVDANGNTYDEIDKRDPKRTHSSDALGYYVEAEHGSGFKGKATRDTF